MANKTATKAATNGKQWVPPRGIRYKSNPTRPSAPFMLLWRDLLGVRKSQSFASADEREEAAMALADKRADHGREILDFDPHEWRRWVEFKEAAGGVDPMHILREWKATESGSGFTGERTSIADAVTKYLAHRKERPLSEDTVRHFDMHLRRRFAAQFGVIPVREMTPKRIADWVAGLKHPKTGEPMEAQTRRHHRKDVATFFDYCVAQGWIAKNPCDLVPVPFVAERDVELLTLEQGRELFKANRDFPVVGRMALEAFGFLRASRAGRIAKEHINFAERGILLRGEGRKGSKARFRQGHPDNLWKWLDRAGDDCWAMSWWEYRNEKQKAFVRAKLDHSENRLRKTCLSAHLAWKKNQPLTSYLAQHRHTSTTDIYLGVMTEKDGAAWFEIVP